jgi:hypothetical protein
MKFPERGLATRRNHRKRLAAADSNSAIGAISAIAFLALSGSVFHPAELIWII